MRWRGSICRDMIKQEELAASCGGGARVQMLSLCLHAVLRRGCIPCIKLRGLTFKKNLGCVDLNKLRLKSPAQTNLGT